jgi:hypothetical protein
LNSSPSNYDGEFCFIKRGFFYYSGPNLPPIPVLGKNGRFTPEYPAGLCRVRWQVYAGTGGRIPPEFSTGCPMRKQETEGRKGKQADGSAKTREVKLAVLFSADSTDDKGKPIRDRGSVSYNAAIESAATRDLDGELSDFANRIEREVYRRGFHKAKRQVILGDGARWIWSIADEQFPNAVQIIDLYHAKGTISNTAKAIFGAENEFGAQWAKDCRDNFEDGNLD